MLAILPAAVLLQTPLQADLAVILQSQSLERASVGVYVKEVGGLPVFERNPDKRLIPASTLKLVTASFALEALGTGHQFRTRAWRVGNKTHLVGAADPLLTIEELLDLGDRIGTRPGDTVHFDDSLLGEDRVNGAWEYGDMMRGDAPPVSGLTVNGGYATLAVAGDSLRLTPRNFGMAVKRVPGNSGVRREFGKWTVTVSGPLPLADPKFATVSLPDPALCAARVLAPNASRAKLQPPADGAEIAKRTYADVLPAILKRSDNHAAETVLRLAGVKKGGSGSWDEALSAEGSWLQALGISASSFRLADGSGLSRFNEVTPRAMVQMLEWTLRRDTAGLFASSMCVPGEGTLSTRLRGVPLRAKTGALTGVCALVGFVDVQPKHALDDQGKLLPVAGPAQKRYLFAIIFNHYDGPAAAMRAIQDAIIYRLVEG